MTFTAKDFIGNTEYADEKNGIIFWRLRDYCREICNRYTEYTTKAILFADGTILCQTNREDKKAYKDINAFLDHFHYDSEKEYAQLCYNRVKE